MGNQPTNNKLNSWTLVASELGVERGTLLAWRKRSDSPKSKDLVEWKAYVEKNQLGAVGLEADMIGRNLRYDKTRFETELLKAKIDREARRVIPREDVSRLLLNIATRQRTQLYQFLETELPPKLDGLSASQQRPIIREVADSICETMAGLVEEFEKQL